MILGDGGTANGVFNQYGGTHTVGNDLRVGDSPGSRGTYNLTGGSLSVTGNTVVGNAGSGVFPRTIPQATPTIPWAAAWSWVPGRQLGHI